MFCSHPYRANYKEPQYQIRLQSNKHMKPTIRNAVLAGLVVLAVTPSPAARAAELKTEVEQAIDAFNKADSSLKKLFDDSIGYAVFPSVGKGGFIIGGERGKGLVYEKGKPIGEVTLTEVNIGAQVGGEHFYEVIFFQTEDALKTFKESKYEMAAEANAVAAAEGAAKNAKYQQGVAIFTLPRGGLMVQASIGGQKFKFKPLD
jgi:lipid-binding SYLF domain-containing protein